MDRATPLTWHDMSHVMTCHDMSHVMTCHMSWHVTWHDVTWHDMTCSRRAFRTGGIRTWGRNWAVKTNWLVIITIIRPHYCTMWSIVTNRVAWSDGLSVCLSTLVSDWIDGDAISVEDSGGPREPCIRWGVQIRPWEGAILSRKGAYHSKV